MKGLGTAITAGLRAPVSQWRLVLLLWLARLLPAALVIGLPLYGRAAERLGRHPDSGRLLDPGADTSGFVYGWLSDTTRELADVEGTLFWLVLSSWLLVTLLAGGITARLVHSTGGLFLAECGRYAGRFLRLGLLAAVLLYFADAAVNALLAESHAEGARLHHTQAYSLEKSLVRGALFLTFLQLLGALHSYARIEIVARERRSVVLAYIRALGTLIARLPKLLLLELAMLAAVAGAALAALLLLRIASPLSPDAGGLAVGVFMALALIGSYLRTGIELGTLEARCRLLVPSRIETPPPATGEGPSDLPSDAKPTG